MFDEIESIQIGGSAMFKI